MARKVNGSLSRQRRATKKGEAGPERPTPPRTGGRLISRCQSAVALTPPHDTTILRFTPVQTGDLNEKVNSGTEANLNGPVRAVMPVVASVRSPPSSPGRAAAVMSGRPKMSGRPQGKDGLSPSPRPARRSSCKPGEGPIPACRTIATRSAIRETAAATASPTTHQNPTERCPAER